MTDSPSDHPVLALLGTGAMGFPMARRLCQAGFAVHVWNRTASKANGLTEYGAIVHPTAAEAAARAHIVISMLENGQVVREVLFNQGVADAMRPGALWIDMASIAPTEAREHAQQLAVLGLRALDAPVSGGTVGAEQGTLSIMAGGSAADFAEAQIVFAPLGRSTHVGPAGSGQLAKVANQMIVGTTIGAVAEALILCAKGGADMGKVREALMGGFADSRILTLHGERMVQRDFAKRARMDVQLKDMRNAMSTAAELDCTLPIASLVEQLYGEAIAHGLAELDHSGLFVELAHRNGVE
ncbi:MAG: NAD(P)-dependent oxidoreductase [Brachymonas denitrificans]|uniref:NAD(P)-dependent oxidoreductase n=1 Tax=Brachymonas denitrificans TaxID=28220 RepID=UPI00352D5811